MTPRRRAIAATAAVVVAALAVVGVRAVVAGRGALTEGDEAFAVGRTGDAIAAWESAARWYFPGASHVDEAYQRLIDFARDAGSIAAWRAVRSAAHATSSLWTPHADDLALANAAIAELSASDPEAAPAIADPAIRAAWHRSLLDRSPRPARLAVAAALAGIVVWLIGIALLVWRGDRRSLAIAAIGVLGWAVGLYTA